MSNPTSNYSFQMPTSTDLVTDLPADFEVFGQAVDTRLKALQPGTTLGDLAYSSATANTNTRLALGTAGQVLKVNSGATAPEWGSPPNGLTFISRTSFTNVASQSIDSIFSSSYFNYVVVLEQMIAASVNDDLQIRLRHGSTTVTGSLYNGNLLSTDRNSTTITNTNQSDTPQFTIGLCTGNSTYSSNYTINFSGVGNSSQVASWNGLGNTGGDLYGSGFFGGQVHSLQTYTGILLKSSSSNISGIVTVYGLAKA